MGLNALYLCLIIKVTCRAVQVFDKVFIGFMLHVTFAETLFTLLDGVSQSVY